VKRAFDSGPIKEQQPVADHDGRDRDPDFIRQPQAQEVLNERGASDDPDVGVLRFQPLVHEPRQVAG
jgi:hypothetical protein